MIHSGQKNNGHLSQSFCKQYSKIRLNNEASFQERMQFDIFKRSTKHERLQTYESRSKERLTPDRVDDLFNRLIRDTKERELREKYAEDEKVKEEIAKMESKRRLTIFQSNQLYQRLVEKAKQVADKVEAQRVLRKQEIEQEQTKYLNVQKNSKGRKSAGQQQVTLLSRVYKDIEERKSKLEEAREQKKKNENEKVRSCLLHVNS